MGVGLGSSYFTNSVINHYDKKQLKEEVCFSLWFQRVRIHKARKARQQVEVETNYSLYTGNREHKLEEGGVKL